MITLRTERAFWHTIRADSAQIFMQIVDKKSKTCNEKLTKDYIFKFKVSLKES